MPPRPSIKKMISRYAAGGSSKDEGFSLIELVVVVAVIAILAAVAVPAFTGMTEKSARATSRLNLKNAFKECAYATAQGQATKDYDMPDDDAYYEYTHNGANAGDCYKANGDAVTLTATGVQGTDDGNTLEIDLGSGAKSGTASWAQ